MEANPGGDFDGFIEDFSGSTGFMGATGSTGFIGATGSTGFIGATGSTGFIGATGSTGFIGATGSTGFIGATGSTGFIGATGSTGFIGATGSTGFQGSTGYTGSTGFIGATGSTGFIGATGSTGFQGSTGYTGSTGPKGPAGVNSLTFKGSIDVTTTAPAAGAVNGDFYINNTAGVADSGWGPVVGDANIAVDQLVIFAENVSTASGTQNAWVAGGIQDNAYYLPRDDWSSLPVLS